MNKVSFPLIGNYSVPAYYLFSHILDCSIIIPPPITKKTIELGSANSPEFTCTPFKYTLGTYIEALNKGANVLIQFGGGCRYGYYFELQEQILKDLGYEFKLVNLVSKGVTNPKEIYHKLKEINPKLKLDKLLYHTFITAKMIKYMDICDDYIRSNIGFAKDDNMEKINKEMLHKFKSIKGFINLRKTYKKYYKKLKKVKLNKPKNRLKIGIIGELYTIMEPFANYYLEKELASYNIEVKRFTNVHFLLFEKHKKGRKYLKYTKEYNKYKMGADSHDNIARCKYLCKNNYDGIIHIKSAFCTPEIGIMSIINKICKEHNVPVIFFSFDANTSEVGIKTRLEAFYDMIEMRKKSEELLSRN